MNFTFVCKFCNQHLEAEDSWAGMEVPCPCCNKNIVIPSPKEVNDVQNGNSVTPNMMGEFLYLTRFPEWPLHIDGCLKIDHPLLKGNNTLSKDEANKLATLIYQIQLHTQDGRVWTLRDVINNENGLISDINFGELQGVLIACLRFPVESSVWNDGIKLLKCCYKLHNPRISPFLITGLLVRSGNLARQKEIVEYLDIVCDNDREVPQYIAILARAKLGKYMMEVLHDEKAGKGHIIQAGELFEKINRTTNLSKDKLGGKSKDSIPPELTLEEWNEYNDLPVFFHKLKSEPFDDKSGKPLGTEKQSEYSPFAYEYDEEGYSNETYDLYSRVDFSKFRGTLSIHDRIQALDIMGRIILKEKYDKFGNDPNERNLKLLDEMKLKKGVFSLRENVLFFISAMEILQSEKNTDIEPEVALNCVAYKQALNWAMVSDDNIEIDYEVNVEEDLEKDLEEMQRNLEIIVKVIKRMKELFK